ncbi:HTH_Tnp_Tc3_2 domain-containing protein [Trichonephila clavipes]|nr:HTH_Tnp_Tc3_2 domain-containing protein [Trichonephila clavipes]
MSQLVVDPFIASGTSISAIAVERNLYNASLCARRPTVCVLLNEKHRYTYLCWTREHISWTRQQWDSEFFTDASRFAIQVDVHTELHVFHERTLTDVTCWDKVLERYVHPCALAIGN